MMRMLGLVVAAPLTAGIILIPATQASAHPLGNFSVNQYVGLVVSTDHVGATVVVDAAEIPTLQDRSRVDIDADDRVSPVERAAHAATTCAGVASSIHASVDGDTLRWHVTRAGFDYGSGAAGLDVSRLTCTLRAPAALGRVASLRVDNAYLSDRIGWREMTATGAGVRLVGSPLPARSVSDELRAYPADLLASVLDIRSATIRVQPGIGGASGGDDAPAALPSGGDPLSSAMAGLERRFADLAGAARFTPLVGTLAVLLAVVLGAGHAVLPGHGKTVLAAYLAGKRGRRRDAITVAATVTITHTGGVLALGLLLTAGVTVAGDRILSWLGLVSGAVVLAVGASMVASVVRGHRHDHAETHDRAHGRDHTHGSHGHDHSHRNTRWGLAGIGVAGGLVPSPSALVVLLAAIGLGRTGFGVLLVVAYGVGMAATLTGAGLLLVALQRRMSRAAAPGRRMAGLARLSARLQAVTPAATATLVVLVGTGLALRAAAGVL